MTYNKIIPPEHIRHPYAQKDADNLICVCGAATTGKTEYIKEELQKHDRALILDLGNEHIELKETFEMNFCDSHENGHRKMIFSPDETNRAIYDCATRFTNGLLVLNSAEMVPRFWRHKRVSSFFIGNRIKNRKVIIENQSLEKVSPLFLRNANKIVLFPQAISMGVLYGLESLTGIRLSQIASALHTINHKMFLAGKYSHAIIDFRKKSVVVN